MHVRHFADSVYVIFVLHMGVVVFVDRNGMSRVT